MENVLWSNEGIGLKASYQVVNDGYIFAGINFSEQKGEEDWTAPYFLGKLNTISAGINFGF